MNRITYEIPVENMETYKKKWWQFWRKKGDSAEETIQKVIAYNKGEIKWKEFDRKYSIRKIYNIDEING